MKLTAAERKILWNAIARYEVVLEDSGSREEMNAYDRLVDKLRKALT